MATHRVFELLAVCGITAVYGAGCGPGTVLDAPTDLCIPIVHNVTEHASSIYVTGNNQLKIQAPPGGSTIVDEIDIKRMGADVDLLLGRGSELDAAKVELERLAALVAELMKTTTTTVTATTTTTTVTATTITTATTTTTIDKLILPSNCGVGAGVGNRVELKDGSYGCTYFSESDARSIFKVPGSGASAVQLKVTMIGDGGDGGNTRYYPAGGGGSGYYVIEKNVEVTPGTTVIIDTSERATISSPAGDFPQITVQHGDNGQDHNGGSAQASAVGGAGGSGGGSGYTARTDTGGKGSGVTIGDDSWFGDGGLPSSGMYSAAERGEGWGAGGGSPSGSSGYSGCAKRGGSGGNDGPGDPGCGGAGGGAGGLIIPICKNYNECNQLNGGIKAQSGGIGVVFIRLGP